MRQLRQLDTNNKKDVEQFVNFPFDLYKDCSRWVPPLLSDFRSNLNRSKHPYYQHSDADFFVVEENGRILGRVAALENKNYNQFRESRAAFLGYFEAVEDQEVANMLITAVSDWATKRNLNQLIGPRGVNGLDGSVLVDGFEQDPALTISYNFPYYDQLLKNRGLEKRTDYLSGYLPADYILPTRILEIAERVKQRRGYWVKSFSSKRELKKWIPRILVVYEEAFSQTGSYYPPTEAEIERMLNTIMTIADPSLIKLIMKEKAIIGFIFAYHDLSRGLQKANGRLFPFGWFHILRDRRKTEWLNINGIGLLPHYQGLGGTTILYTALADTVHQSPQFVHADVVLVDEQNKKSFADMEQVGVRWYKRHRQYQLDLGIANK